MEGDAMKGSWIPVSMCNSIDVTGLSLSAYSPVFVVITLRTSNIRLASAVVSLPKRHWHLSLICHSTGMAGLCISKSRFAIPTIVLESDEQGGCFDSARRILMRNDDGDLPALRSSGHRQ